MLVIHRLLHNYYGKYVYCPFMFAYVYMSTSHTLFVVGAHAHDDLKEGVAGCCSNSYSAILAWREGLRCTAVLSAFASASSSFFTR